MCRAGRGFSSTIASVAIVLATAPAAADAASVTSSGGMWYSGSPGETNDVTVTIVDGRYVVTDLGATLDPGFGCYRGDEHTASCAPPEYSQLHVDLGDGDDTFHGDGEIDVVHAGTGNDEIHGGAGADRLSGDDGTDLLDGGGGDTFHRGDVPYPDAVRGMFNDSLDGGSGADLMRGGGGDFDRVTYSGRTEPVSVTLDGAANDGEAGEGDLVAWDIQDVTGGAGNDVLRGDSRSNSLDGLGGNDLVDGRGGYHDSANGGDGSDLLLFHDGGVEGLTGTESPLQSGFKFDDLLRCDSYTPDSGVDTAMADATDAGQAGQVSPGDKPCEQVVMTQGPQSVPVQSGRLSVPIGCGAGPATKSCHGDIVVQLPNRVRDPSNGIPLRGAVIARRRFRAPVGRMSRVPTQLNKAGKRVTRSHRRVRAWVTYKYR